MTDKIELNDGTQIRQGENVVAVEVTEEAILLDVESGYFFQLNNTAATIWRLLETPRTFADLCAALSQDFSAGDDVLVADAREFVADLVERRILDLA